MASFLSIYPKKLNYMKKIYFILLLLITNSLSAQKVYHPEREKQNDLVHTKLKVGFNFAKKQLNGEAWITLKPHFYPTDELLLDAKAFDIHRVELNGKKADYNYVDDEIQIDLGKKYNRNTPYTVYIKYTANPEKVKQKGSNAIRDAKGLYFINADGSAPEKPTQIWTQGETESASCWFPTIDSPNQKTTEEIYITVPNKYVTLSNGKLINQTKSGNLRTDYWKMDKKHAPYLFFMGIGDFSIIKDSWNGKPVHYYVEKEYKNVAKDIFGNTPEMMSFFSKITGVPYPWNKYHQMVVRDYVSGAMENTTSVVHGEGAQQKKGQLIDENTWESTIAHELFHHWFGDYVTAESWANIAVNESFATYGEYLWFEHKYGKEKASSLLYNKMLEYFLSQEDDKNLVRFNYNSREDVFDAVSYQKGGVILNMLRDYLGDEAFFEGLKIYLTENAFGTAEVHNLRLAFEKVSGKDLNWFFNQWFYGNGHIEMNVNYDYSLVNNTVTVNISQMGKTFIFPLSIDIYEKGGKVTHHNVWVDKEQQSFTLPFDKRPKLINIDAKHVLLAKINDKKTVEHYIFQYKNAPHFLDRKLALEALVKEQKTNKDAFNTFVKALNDSAAELRIYALSNLDLSDKHNKKSVIRKVEKLAEKDPKTLVRANAIKLLGKLIDPKYKPLFERGLKSLSFGIINSSIIALYEIDKAEALQKIKELPKDTKKYFAEAITNIYIKEKDKSELPFIANHLLEGLFMSRDKSVQNMYGEAFRWVAESNNEKAISNLTDKLVTMGKRYKKYGADKTAVSMLNQILYLQQQSEYKNKESVIKILKKGIAKLLE